MLVSLLLTAGFLIFILSLQGQWVDQRMDQQIMTGWVQDVAREGVVDQRAQAQLKASLREYRVVVFVRRWLAPGVRETLFTRDEGVILHPGDELGVEALRIFPNSYELIFMRNQHRVSVLTAQSVVYGNEGYPWKEFGH